MRAVQQIPPRCFKLIGFYSPALINSLHRSTDVVPKSLTPCQISVSSNHTIGCPTLKGFSWIKGGVNTAKYHEGASLFGKPAHGISPESISGMNSNPYNIPGRDRIRIEGFQSFIA